MLTLNVGGHHQMCACVCIPYGAAECRPTHFRYFLFFFAFFPNSPCILQILEYTICAVSWMLGCWLHSFEHLIVEYGKYENRNACKRQNVCFTNKMCTDDDHHRLHKDKTHKHSFVPFRVIVWRWCVASSTSMVCPHIFHACSYFCGAIHNFTFAQIYFNRWFHLWMFDTLSHTRTSIPATLRGSSRFAWLCWIYYFKF